MTFIWAMRVSAPKIIEAMLQVGALGTSNRDGWCESKVAGVCPSPSYGRACSNPYPY